MSSAAATTDSARASATWTAAGLAVLLCAGSVALAFSAGGYFAGTTGVAVAGAAVALALAAAIAPVLVTRWPAPMAVAVTAFGAFALWTLLSSNWSHAPARALIEADRAILYALAVAMAGLVATVAPVRRAAQAGLVGALTVICISGLITRLVPSLWPTPAEMELERLSYPVGYWNALGAIAALAAIGCVHLAADGARHRLVRAAAAAAMPLVATTIVLTFSRGAIAVGILGVVLVLALARTPGTAAALLATIPTSAIAVAVVLRSDAIVDAAAHPGAGPALAVAACAIVAGAVQAALHGWRPGLPAVRPRIWRSIAAGLLAVIVIGGIASGAAGKVVDRAGSLTESSHVVETGDERARLTQFSDNGRIDGWRVSLDVFADQPLHGTGAGTFALNWARDRPGIQEVNDGHSLLFESLGELGIIGTGLLVLGLGALGWGAIRILRTPQRPAAALGLAVLAVWTVHACIDWDWEMPALTLPALAIVALAAGARRREPADSGARFGWAPRVVAVLALACLAVFGGGLALSQRDVDAAVAAVQSGDCATASEAARAAQRYGDQRPEPHQVLAVCAVQSGDYAVGLAQMQRARELDPDNWRLVYNIAVITALDGRDPRPIMREARQLNPRSWLLRIAQRELGYGGGPEGWRTQALKENLLV